jgi:quercetin dioxygenase-like cupin family protein
MHHATQRTGTVFRAACFLGACAATLYMAAAATAHGDGQKPAAAPVSAMTPGLSVQQLARLRGVAFAHELKDVPGKNLVVVNLQFPPHAPQNSKSARCTAHHHPGSVWVYVTKGTARLGLAGQPVQVVHAGESFYEPPGSTHVVGESASATEPVSAIAVMIVPDGAPLVTPASCGAR